ncbi:MAG: tetratricopeptide repeat protein [Candidatus Glassbacteria bacterium]
MHDLDLIGRETELKALTDRLREFIDKAEKRQAIWLHMVGEEGAGRTRLLGEAIAWLRSVKGIHLFASRDHRVRLLPYGAFATALAAELGVSFWESEYAKKEKLESRLAALSALRLPRTVYDPETILPVFCQLLGITYPVEFQTGVRRLGKGRLKVLNAIRRYLQALRAGSSQEKPNEVLVLWFDDLERVDRLSLELLVHLVQKKETLWPLVILSSSCSSFSGKLDYLDEFDEFSLGRVSKLSRRRILSGLEETAGGGPLPARLQRALVEGAPGNPQLLIECYRLLSDRSQGETARSVKKRLVEALESRSRALEVISLPTVIRDRLKPLDPDSRVLLQVVAVLGPYSSAENAAALLSRSGYRSRGLDELVERLSTGGWLQSPAEHGSAATLRLVCPLAGDILLESMPADRLTTLRQQCAELLQSQAAEDGRDVEFAVAGLLAGSYFLRTDWAGEVLVSAGDRLCLLEDYESAGKAYDEALARAGLERAEGGDEARSGHDEMLVKLLVKAGKARVGKGETREAFGTLSAAFELARLADLPVPLAEAGLELGEMMQSRGDWSGAGRFFAESLKTARAAGDDGLVIRSLISSGSLGIRREDYGRAQQELEGALELAGAERYADLRLEVLLGLGYIQQQNASYQQAEQTYEKALELARERRDETAAVTALSNLGRLRYEQAKLEEALDLFHQALDLLRNWGDLQQTGNWLGYIGSIYFSLEEYETAIDYYRQALSLARRAGSFRNQGIWLANLGNAYYEIKEIVRALDHYLEALEYAREDQDYSYVSTILSTIGVYYYNLKQYDSALRYFEESLALALSSDNHPITVQNVLYHGSILSFSGRPEEAERCFAQGEALAVEHGLEEHRAVAELFRGQAQLHRGNASRALEHCRRALKIAQPTGNRKLGSEIERAIAACRKSAPGKKKGG